VTLHLFPDVIQGTDEWHDQRRGIVTASAVGRLVTVSRLTAIDYACPACETAAGEPCRSKVKRDGEAGAPIKTLHPERVAASIEKRDDSALVFSTADNDESRGLTALLVAERITGYTDPTYISDDMLRGIEDEPLALEKYAEHYAPVETTGFMVRDDWGFPIGYSPDGLVGDDGLIEVKSRRQKKQLLTILAGRVPAENMAQLQCGLLVSGRKWIDYVSYCGGMPMLPIRVLPDPRWHEAIVAAAEQFERTAFEWLEAYDAATEGLPKTERAIELEMVI
jgi:hypothetical protein